jgi:hypothetical protein
LNTDLKLIPLDDLTAEIERREREKQSGLDYRATTALRALLAAGLIKELWPSGIRWYNPEMCDDSDDYSAPLPARAFGNIVEWGFVYSNTIVDCYAWEKGDDKVPDSALYDLTHEATAMSLLSRLREAAGEPCIVTAPVSFGSKALQWMCLAPGAKPMTVTSYSTEAGACVAALEILAEAL